MYDYNNMNYGYCNLQPVQPPSLDWIQILMLVNNKKIGTTANVPIDFEMPAVPVGVVTTEFAFDKGDRIIENTEELLLYVVDEKHNQSNSNVEYYPKTDVEHGKVLVGSFVFDSVTQIECEEGYKDRYILVIKGRGRNRNTEEILEFDFTVGSQIYENGRLTSVLYGAGLGPCFAKSSQSFLNSAVKRYIENKRVISQTEIIPYKTGFYTAQSGFPEFVTQGRIYTEKSEAIEGCTFPEKSALECEEAISSLFSLIKKHSRPVMCLTAVILHFTAMISTLLRKADCCFSRIALVEGDVNQIREYMDIYGREIGRNVYVCLEKSTHELKKQLFRRKDDIVYVTDKCSHKISAEVTRAEQIRAVENLNFLYDVYCNGSSFKADEKLSYCTANSLCVFIKGYSAEELPSDAVFSLSFESGNFRRGEFSAALREFDFHFVQWLLKRNNIVDFLRKGYKVYNPQKDPCLNEPSILKLVYSCIYSFAKNSSLEALPVDFGEFGSFIEECMNPDLRTDNTENKSFISGQVSEILSRIILSGEAEVIHSDKVFTTKVLTDAPKIYLQDNVLYMSPKFFDSAVASKVGGKASVLDVKKQLLSEGVLICDGEKGSKGYSDYSVKIKLSATENQSRYTALYTDILSNEAACELPCGHSTFRQCSDNGKITRILLGYDEHGRKLYWSIGHSESSNRTMLVTGSRGQMKSSFVFRVAQELLKKGETVVYIDYNNSCTPSEFCKFGASDEWISENVRYLTADVSDMETALLKLNCLETSEGRSKILVISLTDGDFEAKSSDKAEYTDVLLKDLMHRCLMNDYLNMHVIIDEINIVDLGRDSVISEIINYRRKAGISLIMISPNVTSLKPESRNTLQSASTKVIFSLDTNSERDYFSKNIGIGSERTLQRELGQLKKGSCFVYGHLENRIGELSRELVMITVPRS